MRSSTYIALLAGSAAAQSSVSIFNLYPFAETLTQIGADATATTYKFDCPASNAGISVIPSSLRPAPDATITPAPTPRGRLARQAPSASFSRTSDPDDYDLCEPFTIKQGPSTYEFHMTDPLPGAWTVDMNCKWQGAITAADLDCTASVDGYAQPASFRGKSTTVFAKDDVSTMDVIQEYAIVTSSGAGSASASATPTGSQSGSAAPRASNSGSGSGSGSGAAAASPSTGLAPAGALPTGAMALVGAGVFAALAL